MSARIGSSRPSTDEGARVRVDPVFQGQVHQRRAGQGVAEDAVGDVGKLAPRLVQQQQQQFFSQAQHMVEYGAAKGARASRITKSDRSVARRAAAVPVHSYRGCRFAIVPALGVPIRLAA